MGATPSEPEEPRLRGIAQRLVKSPRWQLVIGGAILALMFPAHLSGTLGMTALAGAAGVWIAMTWPTLPDWVRQPPAKLASAAVVAMVVMLGLSTFWDTITISPDWQGGDWGPQHAVLARVIDQLPGFDTTVWNHAVGTGDAPLELYPKLTYLVTGHAALLFGLEDDLPLAMMIVAVTVHILVAAMTALMATAVAPRPIAVVVGCLALVESGAVAHGGTVGLFKWALLHSAMALAFTSVAAVGILGALRRPHLGWSITIWIGTALACATHPAGLIGAAACAVALGAVALLASDVPPRRALFAIGHIVLGIALGAAVWMPLAERILAYGQHFPNAIRSPSRLLEDLLASPSPISAFAMLTYAGYFGILVGLWSRRATAIFVAAGALTLLVGLCDLPYMAFDLAPGKGVARLGTERLAQLARPFVMAAGAYGIAILFGHAVRAWSGAPRRNRLVAAALMGILGAAALRNVPTLWQSASSRAYSETQLVASDLEGRMELVAWANARMREMTPDRFGRALFEADTHEHFHLTALTKLPSLHIIWQPDLLLRERIEDLSEESLRRFNIRWSIAQGKSPTLGDPATEQTFGTFHVRELKQWDGQFARIEKGTGTVRVTRLDDEAVEIDVTAKEPVLVALGTGFYPRWRATHASGAAQPTYAIPTIPGGRLHVVGAWVAPGKTTFTVDGPLPSDGKGTVLAILALLGGLGAVVAWSLRRVRVRILRTFARLRARSRTATPLVLQAGVPLAFLVLFVRGCSDDTRIARGLELGSGIRGTAQVEARFGDGEWQSCDYERFAGSYNCEGMVVAFDVMTSLLNDAPPSWAFVTPGIYASAHVPGVEMRVTLKARLAGSYWIAASEGEARIAIEGEAPARVDRVILEYADQGERTIEITAPVPTTGWSFTFVREDTILPPRPFLDGPPATPPDTVRAIR